MLDSPAALLRSIGFGEGAHLELKEVVFGGEKTMGRIDLPQYDMAAVFEAVVNAVAHRDYAMHGARIRLHLYSDRVELSFPGALPNSMTVDDLPSRQTSRNETLTGLLARCPIPTGIPGLETPRQTLMDRPGNGFGSFWRTARSCRGSGPSTRLSATSCG